MKQRFELLDLNQIPYIHLQYRNIERRPTIYADVGLNLSRQPNQKLKDLIVEINESRSGSSEISFEGIGWWDLASDISFGAETFVGELPLFVRGGAEMVLFTQPKAYEVLQENFSLAPDRTTDIKAGVFCDVGYDVEMEHGTVSISGTTQYVNGVYVGGGSLHDPESGYSLEDYNQMSDTFYNYADFSSDLIGFGSEVYAQHKQLSAFVSIERYLRLPSPYARQEYEEPTVSKGWEISVAAGTTF